MEDGTPSDDVKRAFNTLLKKSTSYLEELKFNLTITELMVFINTVMKDRTINKEIGVGFLTILSTIAPHITEEIYSSVYKKEGSISKLD
jgi:leucyl-tRNA synthetase